uniref:Uncharacterized protein n=1 Tax=Globodera pallida TaxID=36090 RepID=A0A183BNQ9_GLOPA
MNGDEELMDYEEEEDQKELERVQKLDKEAERKELERLGIIASDHHIQPKHFPKRSRSETPTPISDEKVPRHEMPIIERALAMSEQGLGQREVREIPNQVGDLRNPHPGRFRYILRPRVNHPYYGYNPGESDSYSEEIQQIPLDQTYGIPPQNERGGRQVAERHSIQKAEENAHPVLHPNAQIQLPEQEEVRDRYGHPIAISTPVEEVPRLFVMPPPPQNSGNFGAESKFGMVLSRAKTDIISRARAEEEITGIIHTEIHQSTETEKE